MSGMRTATLYAFVLVAAHESPSRYTVTRDHLAYTTGKNQSVKDVAVDDNESTGTAGGSVAGAGFPSVMELTNLMRMPIRPITHDGDAGERSSFADFVRAEQTKDTKDAELAKGTGHAKGAGDGIEDDLQSQLMKDLHDHDLLNASKKALSEHEEHSSAADEQKTEDKDNDNVSMSNVSGKEHAGHRVWLDDNASSSETKTDKSDDDEGTEEKPDDDDTESAPKPAPKMFSGHLDESELNDAVKYLYKMAGKIYVDPNVEKGYFMRITSEIPQQPTNGVFWPLWFFIELPAGLLGGIIIGGGVPFTSMHGDQGGYYFGLPIIVMMYAVAGAAYLKRKGALDQFIDDLAYLWHNGSIREKTPRAFTFSKNPAMGTNSS